MIEGHLFFIDRKQAKKGEWGGNNDCFYKVSDNIYRKVFLFAGVVVFTSTHRSR